MSIHLNGIEPSEAENGVCFSADVNGRHVDCLITYHALGELNKRGSASALQMFRHVWPKIRDKAAERIRRKGFSVNQPLILRSKDFCS